MNNAPERIWELMAERATQGLSESDARELAQLCRDHPDVDPLAFETAAAAVSLALLKPEPIPAAIKRQLDEAAQNWSAGRTPAPRAQEDAPAPIAMIGRKRGVLLAGWIAAAACLALALLGWWNQIAPVIPLADQRNRILSAGDTVTLPWAAWDQPEVSNVGGDVVWNEKLQKGFLRFTNLPVNNPTKEQYQLWIVDSRGMDQRISGAIFDVKPEAASGTVLIPITPQIRTRGAAAFALTIEEPGGTWVSSMKRRVVIAQMPKG